MPGPEVVIEPNLLLNLARLRQPTDKRKYQENRRGLGPAAAPFGDLPKGASPWATENELRVALQSTENVNGLLLKHETEEVEKVNSMVDGMLSKAARYPTKQMPCQAERQECITCLKQGGGGTETLLQCSKYVDAYESCVSRET